MSEKTKMPAKKPRLTPKPKPRLMPKPKAMPKAKPKDREALPIVSCNGVILFAKHGEDYANKWTS